MELFSTMSHDPQLCADALRGAAPGTEVFIASLPKGTPDQLVTAATQLRRSGVIPVPHIAARA